MSYKRSRKGNNSEKITKTTKTTTVTQKIYSQDDGEDYDNGDLNDIFQAFEYFDINRSGRIKISELKEILSKFGDIMSEEEIGKIFLAYGVKNTDDDNEYIDYRNFINFWIENN